MKTLSCSTIIIEPIVWQRIEYFAPIRKAVSYFEEHLADRVTEKSIAAIASFEETSFSKLFRKRIGLTFREFTEALRISRAIEMMLESDQTLTQIAFAVGFGSLTTFTKAFRRQIGAAPSIYRKVLLKEHGLLS